MACPFSNISNGCGCVIGYELPMQTVEDADISAYPVIVLNVDGLSLGEAHSPSEYVTIWNSNAANQAHGTLFVGTGAFCFYLKKRTPQHPHQMFWEALAYLRHR